MSVYLTVFTKVTTEGIDGVSRIIVCLIVSIKMVIVAYPIKLRRSVRLISPIIDGADHLPQFYGTCDCRHFNGYNQASDYST